MDTEEIRSIFYVIGVALAAIMVWRAIRRREFRIPNLTLGLGPTQITKRRKGTACPSRIPELLLVQGVDTQSAFPCLLMVPLSIKNKGGAPIHNLVIQIEYPSQFQMSGEKDLLEKLGFDTRDIEQDSLKRSVVKGSSRTIVRYEMSTLRARESRVIFEPIMLSSEKGRRLKYPSSLNEDSAKRSEENHVLGLFPFRLYVFSDNTDSIESDGMICYVSANDLDEVSLRFNSFVRKLVEAKPELTLTSFFGFRMLRLIKRPVLMTKSNYKTIRNQGTIEVPNEQQVFRRAFGRVPAKEKIESLWAF